MKNEKTPAYVTVRQKHGAECFTVYGITAAMILHALRRAYPKAFEKK